MRRLFTSGLGAVYAMAFVSLAVQIRGLVGPRGVLPASELLDMARVALGARAYVLVPSLTWLVGTSDAALSWLAWLGVVASCLLMLDVAPSLSALASYVLYLSLVSVGRDFLSFQWDALLLEVGFLAIFVCPWSPRLPHANARFEPPAIVVWLLRFLVFRFMLASGVVKLTSGDPTWRDLSALTFHYETTCLPTWTGWYAAKLGEGVHRASAAIMFFIELVLPFGCFGPRIPRLVAFLGFVGLQIAIGVTGNYGFFNPLTVVLCLSLLDDDDLPNRLRAFLERFGTRPTPSRPCPRPVLLAVAVLLAPLGAFHLAGAFRVPIAYPEPIVDLLEHLGPYRISNGYGLFAVMTTHRPEITIEGSRDGVHWQPYVFRDKPGPLARRPRFVEPHMPRLDWQMWFAALGSADESGFFLPLCRALLEGRRPVLALFAGDPFHGQPPRYLRAWLDEYRFTSIAERNATGAYWKRDRIGGYIPEIELDPAGDGRLLRRR